MASRIALDASLMAPTLSPGAELRAIRRYLGWSQARFAENVGAHAVSIARWETDARPVPKTVMFLARFLVLSMPPERVFLPVVAAQEPPVVHVRPGYRCLWKHNDELPCGGRQYHVQAKLSRRRELVSEVCVAHLESAFAEVFYKLAQAAKAEQQRLAGRKRKQLQRQRKLAPAAQAASGPTQV